MKKSSYKSILMLYSTLFILAILVILIGLGLLAKVITATDPNGNTVKSSWPQEFTDDFSTYFDLNGDVPQINQSGLQQLNENHLWLQVLDENGTVIMSNNTSGEQAGHYAPMDVLSLYQGEENSAETVCANQVTTNNGEWTYLIGFPMNIAKVTMFVDGDSFSGGKSLVIPLMTAAGFLMLVIGGVFGVWIIRHMGKMTQSIGQISYRLYEPIQGNGPFQDVYDSLNEMNSELQKGDRELVQNEKMREEWITNITHDLKTPLSPIRGYGELLADPENVLTPEKRVQYGETILRNTAYAEKLVNDLKLTYQLKNKMLPLEKKSVNLTQFLRELVIEVLNHHEYADRLIRFETDSEAIEFSFDPTLLKRGINNLLYNALIHNPTETAIQVSLQLGDDIRMIIEDNGKGMTSEEIDRLFERYYRGTNTTANTGGTGLGMAIAKQIIEIHDGTLVVESVPGKGTRIIIHFPLTN
ncbi:sensor histidine kinase [Enterococcus sp. AZ109]|uniref:sensor histidine kinase n=1 Tax=Enterococcus sp. AZ109 TaxID=2774634 RepID=UPI003F21FB44